jgi:hypothetical protein
MMSIQPMQQIAEEDDEVDDVDPAADFILAPNKVAVVAASKRATFGYAPYFSAIAETAESAGCDTVVYALARPGIPVMSHSQLFGRTRKVTAVFLEVTEPSGNAVVEVWRRDVRTPHRFRQRLMRSQDSDWSKRALMRGLAARTFGPTMFLACGEANIVSTQRGSLDTVDRFGFLPRLNGRRLILNSSHTYMVRPEMKEKQRRYSEDGRVVLSVWNPGHQVRETKLPWQVFVNGYDASDLIEPIAFPESSIHIGAYGLGSV